MNFPMLMLVIEMTMFAFINPSNIVMALPRIGRKAKNHIQAPRPPTKRCALSRLSFLTCR